MSERVEAYYGLPEEVVFCNRCVMSNQRPASTPEFRNSPDRKIASLHIDEEGVCDACRFAEQKEAIDWETRERELLELLDEHRRTDGTFLPDAQGVILPTDGSSPLIVDFQGFGSTYPSAEQRRVVTSVTHRTANVAFLDLNDSICIGIGENTESPESVTLLTMDVFQAVWTQLDTNHRARPSLPDTITIEPWFRK